MDDPCVGEILKCWRGTLQETKNNQLDTQLVKEIIIKGHEFYVTQNESENIEKNKAPSLNIETLNICVEVLELLNRYANTSYINIDQQILCSTAYFVILRLLPHAEYFHKELQVCHDSLLNWNKETLDDSYCESGIYSCFKLDTLERRNTERLIATRIAGLFQSNFLKPSESDGDNLKKLKCDLMQVSYLVTHRKCLTYSCCTFLHFKNLSSILNKFFEWDVNLKDEDIWMLLYIVFNNWENLISGVCEWNVQIFNCLLKHIIKYKSYMSLNQIIGEIMGFPWNKAKYLTLCEIIFFYNRGVMDFLHACPSVISGLEYSLKHPSLISYGTNLYKTILKEFKSYENWKDTFLELFRSVLTSEDRISKKNLLNYWMPFTIKRYCECAIPIRDIIVEDEESVKDFLSCMTFFKLCRQNGLLFNDWRVDDTFEATAKHLVSVGLNHLEGDVRAEAFHVVCVSKKRSPPCEDEINKVQAFLKYNIHEDSASFRQKILISFNLFFTRLHDAYLKFIKKRGYDDIFMFGEFLLWIFDFIHENLDGFGNYQRKIASLQIYDTLLDYLMQNTGSVYDSERKPKKGVSRDQGFTIVEHMQEIHRDFFDVPEMLSTFIDCLKDNTDDVRETAANIIIRYFINHKEFALMHQQKLFFDALNMCNNPIFYKSASGCLMFKILSKTKYKNEIYANNAVHDYLLKECFTQFDYQKRNILLSTIHNRPLHGVMSALNKYIVSCELEDDFISTTKDLLHSVTDYYINVLSTKNEANFPPSFAEMGESVESIIKSSTTDEFDEDSQYNISDNHQLVLNNIWLNLKASCELSTTVINKSNDSKEKLELLDVCIKVLTRCRHKGAIEAAGVCLGQSVKHMTSLKDMELNKELSKLLESLLLEYTSEDNQGGSITRRSAGLTILVHRFVTNDSQTEKPLFHLAMSLLLQALDHEDPTAISTLNVDTDLPMARALHLLCRSVEDSCLSSYTLLYASRLASMCFRHLMSQHWQIRNGALQLYGALVPKLIGQRKNQNQDVSEAPMSVDELFCHIPSLWKIITNTLSHVAQTNSPISHSDVIPIISLLSATSKRYHLDIKTQQFPFPQINIEDILPDLFKLLASNVWTVRKIAAKIINIFFSSDVLESEITNITRMKENQLHGFALTLKCYVEDYIKFKKYVADSESETKHVQSLNNILKQLEAKTSNREHSFFTDSTLLEIQHVLKSNNKQSLTLDMFDNVNEKSIGLYALLKTKLSSLLMDCNEDELVKHVQTYLCSNQCSDLSNLDILKRRLLENKPKTIPVLKSLFQILLNIITLSSKGGTMKIYELLYILCKDNTSIVAKDEMNLILNEFNIDSFADHRHSYLLPLLCCLIRDENLTPPHHLVVILSEVCRKLSKWDEYDSQSRLLCAMSLKHLNSMCREHKRYSLIDKDTYKIKKNLYLSVIWLLQDENSDVRKECAKVNILKSPSQSLCPMYQLKNLLTAYHIRQNFQSFSMTLLKDVLAEINVENEYTKDSSVNPFNNESCNIYWEPRKIKLKVKDVLKAMKKA